MVRASVQDVSLTSPWGGVSGMPIREETPGQTNDTLERLYLSAGLRTSWFPPGGVDGSGRGEERLDLPAQAVAPATRSRISISNKTKSINQSINQNTLFIPVGNCFEQLKQAACLVGLKHFDLTSNFYPQK